ncbi:DUF58 domain-containing protein [Amantichitinum ursilacus]|uniref:DUF58 domain-containing protein n=1 Tax=Amantichitinum ursilacus TaxID=857265 RepID=A0A0N0GR60_9NEIS|nr:DUF58 domain-containing protein [Amantichitinum ursilacus]KPC55358.1 hypothetical protein WG78_01835 [Amantichitinum ursilacus]
MRHASTSAAVLQAADIGSSWVDLPWLLRQEQRAAGLALHAYRPRSSILAGRQASRVRGRGLNFEELRGYLPGDDVRHIDWKATQRSGKPLVRTYTEERDRPALIVLDQRINMFFGSQRALKSVAAAELAALAAWLSLQSHDRVGGIVFEDVAIHTIAPLRSRQRVQALLAQIVRSNQALNAASSARPQDGQLDKALEAALRVAHHDHLVCVISDFADASGRTRQLLRALAEHNDVVAVLVSDPLLQNLPARAGQMVLTEGELQIELDMRRLRQPVEQYFAQRQADVAALLQRSGVPLLPLSTHLDVLEQLRGFIARNAAPARSVPL